MKLRKFVAILCTLVILVGCIVLYWMVDMTSFPPDYKQNKWVHFQDQLTNFRYKLGRTNPAKSEQINGSRVDEVYHTKFVKPYEGELSEYRKKNEEPFPNLLDLNNEKSNQNALDHDEIKEPFDDPEWKTYFDWLEFAGGSDGAPQSCLKPNPVHGCPIMVNQCPNVAIQTLDVYKKLTFDNPNGGAWKQGWNVEYPTNQRQSKLKVFVVPHSHNDPGWIKTFEDYYQSQTRSILNNMVKKLKEDPKYKFIWAEISFFALWWDEIKEEIRNDVKMLLNNGQLEIVTGGWVMTDEANSHYIAILQQMVEGHMWLKENLQYVPRNSWSIDPFGYSPSMPYLLKLMGLKNLLIQRTHYSVKKYLARNQELEFRWRQLWDGRGVTDFFTHMMPFYSYDVPHTCGPDPKVCCQFDFRRLPGFGIACPWKVPPQTITSYNRAERAELLLDQYRKKAQLYKTNVLLVPLGDDFRYDHESEWDAQFQNYQKLFTYMNENREMNVEAQFGTLKDYFDAVHDEMKSDNFPTLSGDFFTYADRDDHYWSGYYTSRPFYKRMDRVLLSYMRAAEIIYVLGWARKPESSKWLLTAEVGFQKVLREARQSLSLFQHHDGITGTAKDHVVQDYAQKMLEAIGGLQHVIQQVAHFVLSPSKSPYQPDAEAVYFDLDDGRRHHFSIPQKTVLSIGGSSEYQSVVFFNSLTYKRHELVTIRVPTPYVKVTKSDGTICETQTSPVFLPLGSMADSHYDVSFVIEIPALAFVSYRIYAMSRKENPRENTLVQVNFMNMRSDNNVGRMPVEGFENIPQSSSAPFSLENDYFIYGFNAKGMLKSIVLKEVPMIVPIHLEFVRYTARHSKETSGAYLFLPDGPAVGVTNNNPFIRLSKGPLFSEVVVELSMVRHTVRVYKSQGPNSLGLEINNIVDISEQNSNYELAMRLSTNIKNGDIFYTDLNGLQIIKRVHFQKLPLQANYYPLPAMAFIESESLRLSIVSGQPCGVAALKEGQIEVLLDRRLMQDDNRGLGQGVTDNHPTLSFFKILLEKRQDKCKSIAEDHPAGLASTYAHMASLSLLNPILRLLPSTHSLDNLNANFTPVGEELDPDIHLVKFHTFANPAKVEAGVIFHRQLTDHCYPTTENYHLSSNASSVCKSLRIERLFPSMFGDVFWKTSLSFMSKGKALNKNCASCFMSLCPMELGALILSR